MINCAPNGDLVGVVDFEFAFGPTASPQRTRLDAIFSVSQRESRSAHGLRGSPEHDNRNYGEHQLWVLFWHCKKVWFVWYGIVWLFEQISQEERMACLSSKTVLLLFCETLTDTIKLTIKPKGQVSVSSSNHCISTNRIIIILSPFKFVQI